MELRGKSKQIRRIQAGTERGLFNPLVSLGSRWEDEGNEDEYGLPPIIVEGEFNWLSLLAINDEWAQGKKSAYGLMGRAMGGKNGADSKEVKLTFEETPLVIYDRDTLQEDGLPAGFDLVREINKHRAVYACATIGGYPWTVIHVEDRAAYLAALDCASIDMNIDPFAKFIANAVARSTEDTDAKRQRTEL